MRSRLLRQVSAIALLIATPACLARRPTTRFRQTLPQPVSADPPVLAPGHRLPGVHLSSPFPIQGATVGGRELWLGSSAGVLRLRLPALSRVIGRIDLRDGLPAMEVTTLYPSGDARHEARRLACAKRAC